MFSADCIMILRKLSGDRPAMWGENRILSSGTLSKGSVAPGGTKKVAGNSAERGTDWSREF
jgi:hypothetical protein